jgi:hypothetical protein
MNVSEFFKLGGPPQKRAAADGVAEPPAGQAIDLQDLSNIYIGPIKPVRDRIDELLQA